MSRMSWLRGWAVVLVLFGTVACEDPEPVLGGETNWLRQCTVDADCELGSCICGACSASCEAQGACDGLSGAVCVGADEAAFRRQCGEEPSAPAGLCLPDCSDVTCPGGSVCEGGACVVVASGSPPGSGVDNPSGDCVAQGDGGRLGYHSPAGDTYVPDCQATLPREYWRIFVQDSGDAYMIPRPDGALALRAPCNNPDHPLNAALNAYTLCQEITQPAAVNAMDLDDALAISRLLHASLVFENDPEGGTFAFPNDILEVCKSDNTFRNGPMQERCDFELEAEQSDTRIDIGWIHDGEQGTVLAAAMNALYGITGEEFCTRTERSAGDQLDLAIGQANVSCTTDTDCVGIAHSSSCHDRCGSAIAVGGEAAIDTARQRVNERSCVAFEAADCTLIIPPCVPPLIRCVDNVCQDG